jgi:hypothetical protein
MTTSTSIQETVHAELARAHVAPEPPCATAVLLELDDRVILDLAANARGNGCTPPRASA